MKVSCCFVIFSGLCLAVIKCQQDPPKPQLPNQHNDEDSPEESHREFVIKNLLPSKVFCGKQHTDDYFYDGNITSVDEFPWMVYIPTSLNYRENAVTRKTSDCVGVLISNQYVLTDTDCKLSHSTLGLKMTLFIGQHHIYKDVNCIKTSFDEDDCTNPISVVYSDVYFRRRNIVLLRLLTKITYSDFVRPICLPLEESDRPNKDEIVVSSGWGEKQYVDGKQVKIKKRIKHILMSNEECEQDNPIQYPICSITLQNSTDYVCPGDNGGPLMYYKPRKNWIVQGIITGSVSCDKHQPVVGERLTPETVEWILENMQA